MFRKTDTNEQFDIFSSTSTYMKGRTAKNIVQESGGSIDRRCPKDGLLHR